MKTRYLGNRVYVSYDGFDIKLKTGCIVNPTNVVVLEPEVLKAFLDFLENSKVISKYTQEVE